MPVKPLPENQRAFDEAHLRTFAHKLPWWVRPTSDRSSYTCADFIQDVCERITRQFPGEQSAKTLRNRKVLSQHVGYHLAAETLFAKVGYNMEFVSGQMRILLSRISDKHTIVIPPDDPLYNKGYGDIAESVSGAPIRIVRASREDQDTSRWLRDYALEPLLRGELCQYCTRDPSTRVIKYCVDLRDALHRLIANLPDNCEGGEWREQCMDPIIDEWVRIAGEGKQREIDALVEECKFQGDVLNTPIREVIADIIRPNGQTPEGARCCLPLVEQIALVLAQRRDTEGLATIGQELNELLRRCGMAVCDSPAIGLAFLAANALAAKLRDFRLRLGPRRE